MLQRVMRRAAAPAGAALLLIALLLTGLAQAQTITRPWQAARGAAIDLAVGSDGAVAAVDPAGAVFLRDADSARWRSLGGAMIRIALAPDGTLWAIDRAGVLRRLRGSLWEEIAQGAVDLAVAGDGAVFVTTNTGSLARYNPTERRWTVVDGAGERIAVDAAGRPWTVSAEGEISRRLDDVWIAVIGRARDVAAAPSGRIVMVGQDRRLYDWVEDEATWRAIPGSDGASVAAVGDGQLWRAQSDGTLFAQGLPSQTTDPDGEITVGRAGGEGGGVAPETVPDRSPITFTERARAAGLVDLAIGPDGSVFGLTASDGVRRWSNDEERFNSFPGEMKALAITRDGLPIGVSTADRLVRHDGVAWRAVEGFALDLIDFARAPDGASFALTGDEAVYELLDPLTRYSRRSGAGQQIAVAPRGEAYWLIDGQQRLFECDPEAGCTRRAQAARDISIGPGGSVFIVDDRFSLRRFDRASGRFDLIRQGDTAVVAVGPRDRPWIIDRAGAVLSAALFPRDESGDRRLATRTEATEDVTRTEATSPAGGIQIVRNISFSSVAVPTSAPGFPNLGSGMTDIGVGTDDIVIAMGYDTDPCDNASGRNWAFNPITKEWAHMSYLRDASFVTGVGANTTELGEATPAGAPPQIQALYAFRVDDCAGNLRDLNEYSSSVYTDANFASGDLTDAAVLTPAAGTTRPDLDVAADDTIVFVKPDGGLKWFTAGDALNTGTDRTDLTFSRVGIGSSLDNLWVVDDNGNVYQYNRSSDSFVAKSVQAADRAQDVGVGHDDTVFIVDQAGRLKKWSATTGGFTTTNKSGVTRVAVDSSGAPIVADFPNSQTVFFGR